VSIKPQLHIEGEAADDRVGRASSTPPDRIRNYSDPTTIAPCASDPYRIQDQFTKSTLHTIVKHKLAHSRHSKATQDMLDL